MKLQISFSLFFLICISAAANTFTIYTLKKSSSFNEVALELYNNPKCEPEIKKANPQFISRVSLSVGDNLFIPEKMKCKKIEKANLELNHIENTHIGEKDPNKEKKMKSPIKVKEKKRIYRRKIKTNKNIRIGLFTKNIDLIDWAQGESGQLNSNLSFALAYNHQIETKNYRLEADLEIKRVKFVAGKTRELETSSYSLIDLQLTPYIKNSYFEWGPTIGFDQVLFLRAPSKTEIYLENFHMLYLGLKASSRRMSLLSIKSRAEASYKYYPSITRTSYKVLTTYEAEMRFTLYLNRFELSAYTNYEKFKTTITEQDSSSTGINLGFSF